MSNSNAPRNSTLRILVGADVPPDPNAGASGTVYQMNAALRTLGHTVDEFWQADMGRRIRHGNLHYLLELPRKYRSQVRRRLRGGEYDVIELNQPHAYAAALDHRRSRRHGVFVNRSHGHEVRSEESLETWRERLMIAKKAGLRRTASRLLRRLLDRQWTIIAQTADGFVVSCEEDASFLADRYAVDRDRIGVVTQGVPEPFLARPIKPFSHDQAARLLYVGQFAFCKSPMMLGKAASQILRANAATTLTWACSREDHDQARSLLDQDVRDRVTFVAWMPQEQLMELYDRHGVFLFPSFFEGFGKAPLEAMSRGLCVVASRTGGMRDYIDDGVSGCLVPIGRPDAMADVALQLMSDHNRCRTMSLAARETAATHTWNRCAEDAVSFYRELIERKRGTAAN